MNVVTSSRLGSCLVDFQDRFNNHTRVKKLIKNWTRTILIEPEDTDGQFQMRIADMAIAEIEAGHFDGSGLGPDDRILLRADEDVLVRIFSGTYNPATAHIDGALAVFSSERDKVKLEAISMVIWGLD